MPQVCIVDFRYQGALAGLALFAPSRRGDSRGLCCPQGTVWGPHAEGKAASHEGAEGTLPDVAQGANGYPFRGTDCAWLHLLRFGGLLKLHESLWTFIFMGNYMNLCSSLLCKLQLKRHSGITLECYSNTDADHPWILLIAPHFEIHCSSFCFTALSTCETILSVRIRKLLGPPQRCSCAQREMNRIAARLLRQRRPCWKLKDFQKVCCRTMTDDLRLCL